MTSSSSTVFGLVTGLAIGWLSFWTMLRWRRRKEAERPTPAELLHWNPLEERRGLSDLLVRANHIAITVSDVGTSLNFYVDILGLQQIRRPTFDRHGAWLTMGNIELHLIKGIPVIPPVDNLQVGHIALETPHVDEVVCKLRQLNIDVRQNLSVTSAQKSLSKIKPTVTQFFFNDPDGYYLELCDCEILTQFAFNREQEIDHLDYHEGIASYRCFFVVQLALRWKEKAQRHRAELLEDVLQRTIPATKLDRKKFKNLLKRRVVYGDITQGFTDAEIIEAMLRANNSVPLTVRILTHMRGTTKYFQPPAFLEHGHITKPDPFITTNVSHEIF